MGRILSGILVIPAFALLLLHMGYCKLLNLDNRRGEEKVIFAFLPKYTEDDGKIKWLRFLNRKVYPNSDLISYNQFHYTNNK